MVSSTKLIAEFFKIVSCLDSHMRFYAFMYNINLYEKYQSGICQLNIFLWNITFIHIYMT
jgi:hypothetical protein